MVSKQRYYIRIIFTVMIFTIMVTGCIKKPCIIESLRYGNLSQDLNELYQGTEHLKQVLTLDDMIEIALSRNLDLMVKCQEVMIQQETACHSKLKMIPSLIANYENSGRDRDTASFSESLISGVPPAPLSISSETHVERFNVDLTWNLLDFGLSYFRARQEVNRTFMQQMEYCRLKQNIVLNVTRQYWKAVVAKMSIGRADQTIKETKELSRKIERQVEARMLSSVRGYLTRHDLVSVQVGIKAVERDFIAAKSELSVLMGLPPMIDFDVAVPDFDDLPDVTCDLQGLEEIALKTRPELYRGDIEEKVMVDEVRVMLLQMFPGIELFSGPYYDSNRFLLNNSWRNVGLRATWDLLRLPQHLRSAKLAERQKCLVKLNRLTLSIGVMAQVHLSYLLYREYLEQFEVAKELDDVNKKLLRAAYKELKWGKLDAADVSEYQIQALLAEISLYKAYGELQTALEQVGNAMGAPRYFANGQHSEAAPCSVCTEETTPYYGPEPFEDKSQEDRQDQAIEMKRSSNDT